MKNGDSASSKTNGSQELATWIAAWSDADMQSADVVVLSRKVARGVALRDISLQQAGIALSPLTTHPVAASWPDGELVALGLFAHDLAQGPGLVPQEEQEYLWSEILACLGRIELAQHAP